jgi:hypothetical protein
MPIRASYFEPLAPWAAAASALLIGCGGQGGGVREQPFVQPVVPDPRAQPFVPSPSAEPVVPQPIASDSPPVMLLEPVSNAGGVTIPHELTLTAEEPARLLEPIRIMDLAPLFPADAVLVGYAVGANTGTRYVLDATRGIFELTPRSFESTPTGATLVFSLPDSTVAGGDGDGTPPSELTDIESTFVEDGPSDTLVLTAENDGYVLRVGSSILQSYFCYVPNVYAWPADVIPSVSQTLRAQGIDVKERTDSVVVNGAGQIIAQPRTFRLDTGEHVGTELFVFDASGGQPINTLTIAAPEFRAGGMSVLAEDLVLGYRNELYRIRGLDGIITRVGRIEGSGSIEGLDFGLEGIAVLDGPGKRLYEIAYGDYFLLDWGPSDSGAAEQ